MTPIQSKTPGLARKDPKTTRGPYTQVIASIVLAMGFLGFLIAISYPATALPVVIAVIATVTVRQNGR